jgi:hypothetical protein
MMAAGRLAEQPPTPPKKLAFFALRKSESMLYVFALEKSSRRRPSRRAIRLLHFLWNPTGDKNFFI